MELTMIYTLIVVHFLGLFAAVNGDGGVVSPSQLDVFVDELPDMPRIKGYDVVDGVPVPKALKITMFQKYWKFHKDLPPTKVFAYGKTKRTATVPGPTIEAVHGVSTHVRWQNRLPSKHILPWDPTIPTAIPRNKKGVPTVVHLHGGIDEPESDGNSHAWFTAKFQEVGPHWTKKTYHYHNQQQPGNLYYHDHAMGLTRVNLLAGLLGAYIIRHPSVEAPLGLPCGDEFDRPLVVFDRSFTTNGSIYMDPVGNNPDIHPHWNPEYFGDVIVVNGKAWPYMNVRRRKYRFRIINASNARFFKFFFGNGLRFFHVGSDSVYNEESVLVKDILVGPSEIADVVVDFSKATTDSAILHNGANYPYPTGDPVNESNGKVMKFVISRHHEYDSSHVPLKLLKYPTPSLSQVSKTRYIAMYEYKNPENDEPIHLYINGKPYDDPVTEKPKVGSTEIWNVINLTEDNHPLHVHLGLFKVLDQTNITNIDEFKDCMKKYNNAEKCKIEKYARGKKLSVEPYEKGWKNVYKMQPGYVTKIIVKFAYIHTNASYPFDATAEPGYIYHCHILDHEDNVMMRPLKMKFHKDLPPTKVFAYGKTKRTATVPGPTIEAVHGVSTHVRWQNRLPSKHILPWDPTIPTAIPRNKKGVPTVVHLHGGIDEPESDGNSHAWFTAKFQEVGPRWTKKTYHYHNQQQPGNLYYHDHAMGLTRVNLLAGLLGAYIIRHPSVEAPLGLPCGDEFDRPLVVFDRSFTTNGSIYMDPVGNNPDIHPHWNPEYFGDVIVVNGKAWPYMNVRRRKYRFRIINASNARFFKFFFGNGLRFFHVGSDSVYNEESVLVKDILVGPSEIADVVVDFSMATTDSAILHNGANYPYPTGDPVNESNGKVMKFVISRHHEFDSSHVPLKLLKYPTPSLSQVSKTRYIAMYEYKNPENDEPIHLYISGKPYDDPVTEKPKVGSTEIWNVINLTEDNHPLHIHLGLFKVLDQTNITNIDEFRDCMNKYNNAEKCEIEKYARGKKLSVEPYEKGWKNVYKMQPGYVTKIIVKFAYIHTNASYPFDATAEPGYVYHCHILDHEDNVMMRPLKMVK